MKPALRDQKAIIPYDEIIMLHDRAYDESTPDELFNITIAEELGDVIREQEGKAAYELIERVRQLSVAYRLKKDASAGRVLDRLLKNLSADQTVSVIRAFSYFSHLANIAEDRHNVRLRDLQEQKGELREGDVVLCMSNGAFGGLPRKLVAALG